MSKRASESRRRFRRPIVLVAVGLLLVWLTFFDSHSFVRRALWWQESTELRRENEELSAQIEAIQASLEAGLTDEDVERIAREQYGMRRPGETVYPEQWTE